MKKHLLNPQRGEKETFEQYKSRRASANVYAKVRAKGSIFWNSFYNGTYCRQLLEMAQPGNVGNCPAIKLAKQRAIAGLV